MKPDADVFQAALQRHFAEAQKKGKSHIEIRSGDLHSEVGGYPGHNHRMPTCCDVMRSEMHGKDNIVGEPPRGKGANLIVRYILPRMHL